MQENQCSRAFKDFFLELLELEPSLCKNIFRICNKINFFSSQKNRSEKCSVAKNFGGLIFGSLVSPKLNSTETGLVLNVANRFGK